MEQEDGSCKIEFYRIEAPFRRFSYGLSPPPAVVLVFQNVRSQVLAPCRKIACRLLSTN